MPRQEPDGLHLNRMNFKVHVYVFLVRVTIGLRRLSSAVGFDWLAQRLTLLSIVFVLQALRSGARVTLRKKEA